MLHDSQEALLRHTASAAAQQSAAAELTECQQALQDSQAQYITTKSKLIGSSKQLADVAKDHSSVIELLQDSDTTATDATHRAKEATHRLGVVSERLGLVSEQLGVVSQREAAASAQLGYLRGVHAAVVAELRRYHTLLAALARLPQQGIKVGGGGFCLTIIVLGAYTQISQVCKRLLVEIFNKREAKVHFNKCYFCMHWWVPMSFTM